MAASRTDRHSRPLTSLSYFVDQGTKYRFNAYSSELQAARFRGKRHTAEHNRNMSEALKEVWKRVTPEEKARRIAARVARGYQKCRPGCRCATHDPEVCAKRREKVRGKKLNVSLEGLWRQDLVLPRLGGARRHQRHTVLRGVAGQPKQGG